MTTCNRNLAERLLQDELNQAETQAFEEHLAECSTCQSILVEAAGGQHILANANALFSSSVELPRWTPVPDPLRAATLSGFLEQESRESLIHTIDLSILTPSDDPDFLGRIGIYEVQGIIGRGGMGIVFRALDRALSRNVAIKVLDPSMASVGVARQRFAMEARAMAAISHEHVVPVYAVDEHRGLPYFAMEYIPGGTLESRIRQQGPLDLLSILQIARQIALALSAAHECGLVHRDIKPANVLLDKGIERVRVADFGLARVSCDASYTRSGLIAGTPQFMAPEQVRGELCTSQSDLFSLGSVMYCMCTGHSPFRCESIYGSMQRVVHEQPRSIRLQATSIPEWLECFILKLLSKSPENRFQDAIQVAVLLEKEIAHAQNPSTYSKPERLEYCPVHAESTAELRSVFGWPVSAWKWGAVTALALAVCCSVYWNPLFRSPETIPKTDLTVLPKSDALLWGSDGTGDAVSVAVRLERSYLGSDPPPLNDPWHKSVQELKQALDAYETKRP